MKGKGLVAVLAGVVLLCGVIIVAVVAYWAMFLNVTSANAIKNVGKKAEALKSFEASIEEKTEMTTSTSFEGETEESTISVEYKYTIKNDIKNEKAYEVIEGTFDYDGEKETGKGEVYVVGEDYYLKMDGEDEFAKNDLSSAEEILGLEKEDYEDYFKSSVGVWSRLVEKEDEVEYVGEEKFNDVNTYKYKVADKDAMLYIWDEEDFEDEMRDSFGLSDDEDINFKTTETYIWINKSNGNPVGLSVKLALDVTATYSYGESSYDSSLTVKLDQTFKYSNINKVGDIDLPSEIED